MRQRQAEARLLDTSGKPGQNHTCKFSCMWLVRDNFFRYAWTSGPITQCWCSQQHERTFSELLRNGGHETSPNPARFSFFSSTLPNNCTLSWGLALREKARKKVFLFPLLSWIIFRCVHRRGNRNASCSAGVAWSGSVCSRVGNKVRRPPERKPNDLLSTAKLGES